MDSSMYTLDQSLGGALHTLFATEGFTGAKGSSVTIILPTSAPFDRCVALGLGRPSEYASLRELYSTWGQTIAAFARGQRIAQAAAGRETHLSLIHI